MKNNKFTDGKIGDKVGEMKKQAKGNETPQRASRQVLGDVMKESAVAGLSYVRSLKECEKLGNDFFETHDIHIHIPEGAVPKDGPSAGITMATALYSAIFKKTVKGNLAMTGEITIRGDVLPIGDLRLRWREVGEHGFCRAAVRHLRVRLGHFYRGYWRRFHFQLCARRGHGFGCWH